MPQFISAGSTHKVAAFLVLGHVVRDAGRALVPGAGDRRGAACAALFLRRPSMATCAEQGRRRACSSRSGCGSRPHGNEHADDEEFPQAGRKRLILPSPIGTHRHGRAGHRGASCSPRIATRRGVHDGRQPGAAAHAGKAHAARLLPTALRAHRAPPPLPVGEAGPGVRSEREGRHGVLPARHLQRRAGALRSWLLERAAGRRRMSTRRWPGRCAITSRCATSPTNRWATSIPRRTGSTSARTTSRRTTSAATTSYARNHRWYMTSRMITLFDIYAFEPGPEIDPRMFEDIIGRNFRQPQEGLGSTVRRWRTCGAR